MSLIRNSFQICLCFNLAHVMLKKQRPDIFCDDLLRLWVIEMIKDSLAQDSYYEGALARSDTFQDCKLDANMVGMVSTFVVTTCVHTWNVMN